MQIFFLIAFLRGQGWCVEGRTDLSVARGSAEIIGKSPLPFETARTPMCERQTRRVHNAAPRFPLNAPRLSPQRQR